MPLRSLRVRRQVDPIAAAVRQRVLSEPHTLHLETPRVGRQAPVHRRGDRRAHDAPDGHRAEDGPELQALRRALRQGSGGVFPRLFRGVLAPSGAGNQSVPAPRGRERARGGQGEGRSLVGVSRGVHARRRGHHAVGERRGSRRGRRGHRASRDTQSRVLGPRAHHEDADAGPSREPQREGRGRGHRTARRREIRSRRGGQVIARDAGYFGGDQKQQGPHRARAGGGLRQARGGRHAPSEGQQTLRRTREPRVDGTPRRRRHHSY
mmetsp:Transcript_2109/g.9328  ORF Transcript_2109/g.9328 Transcript_2109/m.9328 type:complete len:265 (+) Transcript_2109:531-1325(+)